MLLMMTPSVMFKSFYDNMTREDILDATYIVVSRNISLGHKSHSNAIRLFELSNNVKVNYNPDKDLYDESNREYRYLYYKDLYKDIIALARIIIDSIENNNIYIFLNTDTAENLLHTLKMLQEFTVTVFGIVIFEYKEYMDPKISLYGKKEIKKCKRIIEKYADLEAIRILGQIEVASAMGAEQEVINKLSSIDDAVLKELGKRYRYDPKDYKGDIELLREALLDHIIGDIYKGVLEPLEEDDDICLV